MCEKTSTAVLLFSFFLASCSNHAGSAATASAPVAAGLGKSDFSALVDGTAVSGGSIDDFQQFNAAYTVPDGKGDFTVLFWLRDNPAAAGDQSPHTLRFQFPKRSGTIDNANLFVVIQLDKTHEARYSTSAATVNVNSLSSSRIAGTFSGTLTLSPDTPNVPKTSITVTGGRFDIPFGTSKLIPQ